MFTLLLCSISLYEQSTTYLFIQMLMSICIASSFGSFQMVQQRKFRTCILLPLCKYTKYKPGVKIWGQWVGIYTNLPDNVKIVSPVAIADYTLN